MTQFRDLSPQEHATLLAFNNAHAMELSWLDAASLAALLRGVFYARSVGDLEAFLIALDETHPSYASPNYLWFLARYPRFVYVDRLAVAAGARGKGYARMLYADLIDRAGRARHDTLVCEVNADPPNSASDALHRSLGFEEVGAAAIHGGAKTVRYLARSLRPGAPAFSGRA